MANNILVTTTDALAGYRIVEYKDVVSANIVNGSNFFADWKASITDIFGGQSGTYRRKLHKIYEEALRRLKEEAADRGANAIVGLKVDFGEVSGKDVQMFMVSAVGTAVRIERE